MYSLTLFKLAKKNHSGKLVFQKQHFMHMMEKSTNDDNANWNDNYDTDISNFDDNGKQNEQKTLLYDS